MTKDSDDLSTTLFNGLPKSGFIRQADLIPNILPFSAATLWRMVRTGQFPKPVKISTRITAWRCADIAKWIDSFTTQPAA